MPTIEAVLINCFRPDNIGIILNAIRPQVHLTTVIDCSPDLVSWTADRTLRMCRHECDVGPWIRYAIAGLYEQDFTLLIDDDLCPAGDMVARFMEYSDRYDVVCGMGRKLNPDRTYNSNNSPPGEADIAVRCYLWRTVALQHSLPRAIALFSPKERSEDDIVMCASLNKKVYVVSGPRPWTELPCPKARSSRRQHIRLRSDLCQRAFAG